MKLAHRSVIKQAFNLHSTSQSKSGTGHVTEGLKHSYENKNKEEHEELQPSVLPAELAEDSNVTTCHCVTQSCAEI